MTTTGEERRPLLGTTCDDTQIAKNPGAQDARVTPLPWGQLSHLLLVQVIESLTSSSLYPFVTELVNSTGVAGGDPGKVGYYAGLIESIYFLTQAVFVLQYGRFSDRIGRRPVLLFGLCGAALSIFSFGLSKTFIGLIFTRALSGALNGNVGVSKSMMVELTDETNRAQCFAWLPLTWSTGSAIGPFLGGNLSHPNTLIPSLFDTPFWKKYPYFLSCLVIALFIVCVFVFAVFNLKETLLIRHECHSDQNSIAESGSDGNSLGDASSAAPSTPSVLTSHACIAILNYACLAFTDITYIGILPVVFASPVSTGGLGLSPRSIGLVLGAQGMITGIVPVFFFAPLHRRFGLKRVFITTRAFYFGMVISFPVMNWLAGQGRRDLMWIVMIIHSIMACFAPMSFSCTSMFIAAAAQSQSSLGTLVGISQTLISIIRAIGPAAATSLYALSVERQLLGGSFVYAVLIGAGLVGQIAAYWLKEKPPPYSR